MEKSDDSYKEHDFLTSNRRVFFDKEHDLNTEVISDDNIGQLLSQLTDNIPQNLAKTVPSSETENAKDTSGGGLKLQDPPNLDEILSTDEKLITPTSHNVTILNSACQQVLREIECQLLALLKKNRKEQEIVQNFLTTNGKSSHFENNKKSFLKCAGMPYFKDAHGFQPPPNEDVLRKQKENQLLPVDFIGGFPVWNSTDAKTLMKSVSSYEILRPGSIDWMKISVTDMEGKYSPSECKSKWYMNLNPSINRSKWNLKEMDSLKALSEKYNYQNWDKIALELGTHRTGLQCCIQYMTHTFPTQGKWTKEEDETLQKLVEKYKVKDYIPWTKVVWHFENRSLKQCQERYAYHLGDIKKGSFTTDEDFIIVYLAPKLKNFGEVAKFLPNRVATQVRARYEYLVELSMPKFSKEEDELLSKLMAQYPRDWGTISSHFTNRSRVQCRRRWGYLQRKVKVAGDIQSESENEEVNKSVPESTKSTKKSSLDAENYYKLKRNVNISIKPSKSDKKQSDAYSQLLDYHKNSHKFLFGPKPRISINPEDKEKLVKKMKVTMKSLSVEQVGPLSGYNIDSLSDDCEFDKEDLDVLKELDGSERKEVEMSKKIIPPNYMTLVGLRSLTLNWTKIKNLCNFYKEPPHSPLPALNIETESNVRLLCSDAKKLFKSRLKSLFAFPLLLSSITPDNPKSVYKPKTRRAVKPLSKLKRKEHAKLMNAAYREKLKALNKKSSDAEPCGKDNSEGNSRGSKRKTNPPSPAVKRDVEGKAFNVNGSEPSDKRPRLCFNEIEELGRPLKKRLSRRTFWLDL